MARSGSVAVRQPVAFYPGPNSGRSESTGSPLGGLSLGDDAITRHGAPSPEDLLRDSSEDPFPWIFSFVEDPYGLSSSTSDGTESSRPVCDTPVPTTSREEGSFRQRSKSLDGHRYPRTWDELKADEADRGRLSSSCPETRSTFFRDMIARSYTEPKQRQDSSIYEAHEKGLWEKAEKSLLQDTGIEGGTRPKELSKDEKESLVSSPG